MEDKGYVAPTDYRENVRLQLQGEIYRLIFGNPLAGIPVSAIASITRVLDLGCGPGEWLRAIAESYPSMDCSGIDISETVVNWASAQTLDAGLVNAHFYVGDATSFPLKDADGQIIAENSRDLVNGRMIMGYMTQSLWPELFTEISRILRPGGFFRLINSDLDDVTNSVPITNFYEIGHRAFFKAGKSWGDVPGSLGINKRLPGWFREAGFHLVDQIHTQSDHSVGQPTYKMVADDYLQALQVAVEFQTRYGDVFPVQLEQMREQFSHEAETGEVITASGKREPLRIQWHHLTIVGQKPLTS